MSFCNSGRVGENIVWEDFNILGLSAGAGAGASSGMNPLFEQVQILLIGTSQGVIR